jgi:hypothetical protein
VPFDAAVIEALASHNEQSFPTLEGWLFANPAKGKPYRQEQIQKLTSAGEGSSPGSDGNIKP